MADIPDFKDTEVKLLRATLKARFGRDIPFELADAAQPVDPTYRELMQACEC